MKSLMQMSQRGENLGNVDSKNIHFPAQGASLLAQIERDHFWFTARRYAIIKMLKAAFAPETLGKGVLGVDVGCGTGFTAVSLTESGFPTLGVDVYDGFSEFKKLKKGLGFVQGSIFSIEPEPEFDFLLLLDVLEHVEDDAGFLEQSMKLVKPGGVAIITSPAFSWLWSSADDYAGHLRRYTKKTMQDLIRKLGPPVQVEVLSYFYGTTLLPYWMSRLAPQKEGAAVLKRESELPKWLNRALDGLLKTESSLLRRGGLPLGSSVFAMIRKK